MHHTWCLPGMWLHAMATWPYISLVFLLMRKSRGASRRRATRYSSQAEPHGAWCPITLVLFRSHLSHRLDGSWARTLLKNKDMCVYMCVTPCVTVCVLGRNVGAVLPVGAPSRRQKLPLMTRPTTVVETFLPDVFILFVERTSRTRN